MDARPFLFLDVDGVLNPYAARRPARGFVEHRLAGYRVRLRAADGPALLALADRFDLAWATTWEETANALIAPILGLPSLPVVRFDFAATGYTKHPAIDAFARGRPLVWIDDEPQPLDRAWARDRDRTIPTRIIRTDPGSGLRPEHLAAAARFAERCARQGRARAARS